MKYPFTDLQALELNKLEDLDNSLDLSNLKLAITSFSEAFLAFNSNTSLYSFKELEDHLKMNHLKHDLSETKRIYTDTVKELQSDIAFLKNSKHQAITTLNKDYRDKTTKIYRLKESIPSENNALYQAAQLKQRQHKDKLQNHLHAQRKSILLSINELETLYEKKREEIRLSYDKALHKITSSIDKENSLYAIIESEFDLSKELLSKQSNDNIISIRQTFNHASISFNKKINDLKGVFQEELKDLEADHLNNLNNLDLSKETLENDYTSILSDSNLEYQHKMDDHNKSYDHLKTNYEETLSTLIFEYNNSLSIINSNKASFKSSLFEKLKDLKKESTDTKSIKNLTKKASLYDKKMAKEADLKWKQHQKKVSLHEISYLNELYQWRVEHGKIDLEHKQSALILDHHLKMNLMRLDYRKNYFDSVLDINKKMKETTHLNKISPLELQLKVAANIQDRELMLLSNDTSYLNFEQSVNALEKTANHQYKLNALDYQKSVLLFSKDKEEKVNQITFQIELESLKLELETLNQKYQLEAALSDLEYELSVIDSTIQIDTKLFNLNLETETINSLLSINIQSEKQKEMVLSTILKEALNAHATSNHISGNLANCKKNDLYFKHFTEYFKDQLYGFQEVSAQNISIYLNYLNLSKDISVLDSDEKRTLLTSLILEQKDSILKSDSMSTALMDSYTSQYYDFIINLIEDFYQNYVSFLTSILNYNISHINNETLLLEQQTIFYESNILIKQQIMEKYLAKGYDNNTYHNNILFTLKKYIKKDERMVNHLKNDLQKKKNLLNVVSKKHHIDMRTLKDDQKQLIHNLNLLYFKFQKMFKSYPALNQIILEQTSNIVSETTVFPSDKITSFLDKVLRKDKKKRVTLNESISLSYIEFYRLLEGEFKDKSNKMAKALLKIESEITKNDTFYKNALNSLNRDYSLLIHQTDSQINSIGAHALEDFLKSQKDLKDSLFIQKDLLEKEMTTLEKDHLTKLSLLNENLSSVLLSIDQNTILNHKTMNLNFKKMQTRLSSKLDEEKDKLSQMAETIKNKNDAIINQYTKEHKRIVSMLKQRQLSLKKNSLKLENELTQSKLLLDSNLRDTQKLSISEIKNFQSSYRSLLQNNKTAAKRSYHKDLSDLKKSLKFKDRHLR